MRIKKVCVLILRNLGGMTYFRFNWIMKNFNLFYNWSPFVNAGKNDSFYVVSLTEYFDCKYGENGTGGRWFHQQSCLFLLTAMKLRRERERERERDLKLCKQRRLTWKWWICWIDCILLCWIDWILLCWIDCILLC